jgi:cytochrome c-type biogenesis protein
MVDIQTLGLAITAGSVAALNPCGFAMLPAYLGLVVIGDDTTRPSRLGAAGRAQAATVAMLAGFLVVFGVAGIIIVPLMAAAQRYLPGVTVFIGAGLIGLGVRLLIGHDVTVPLPRTHRGAPNRRLGSMFGYGVAYAIASLSCTMGPFLAVTSATFRHGFVLRGIAAFIAYGVGMALVVGALATAVALAGVEVAMRARRVLPLVGRLSGALLVLVGGYVGYYGLYELRLFFGHGSPADPVIDTALTIQQSVVGWVYRVGLWPFAGALAALAILAVLVGRGVRRNARPSPSGSPRADQPGA